MKFDSLSWVEVSPVQAHDAPLGRLRLNLSAPAAVYISQHGVETLLGYDSSFDVTLADHATFRVDAPTKTRVFIHQHHDTSRPSIGQIYTNIDRTPQESGSVLAVRRELRKHALESRAYIREIREQRSLLQADQDSMRIPDPEPIVQPVPEPQVQPVPEPQVQPVPQATSEPVE